MNKELETRIEERNAILREIKNAVLDSPGEDYKGKLITYIEYNGGADILNEV
jgi:hypothetical protein